MVPNGVIKTDTETVNLSKAYMPCNDFRGIDNLQLQALMLKTAADLYEASLREARSSFLIPSDLIGDITFALHKRTRKTTSTFCFLARPIVHFGIFHNLQSR